MCLVEVEVRKIDQDLKDGQYEHVLRGLGPPNPTGDYY